ENRANQRDPHGYLGHGWGFAWPNDCRIIYNRASARPDGKPWSEKKKLIWWDETKREWTGLDTPDFTKTTPPDAKADLEHGHGVEALGGAGPFTLHPDGVGWLYVPSGLKDGPLPTHYEPLESVVTNPLYPEHNTNPAADKKESADNPYGHEQDKRFPYILSTYRLTEHHTSGAMSRYLPHLAELQPELFAEISPQLAAEIGVENGDYMVITTMRGIVEARALITERNKPLIIDGEMKNTICLPYQFGYKGVITSDVPNDLLAISEEPNVRIMETKALVCHARKGRLPRGKQALDVLNADLRRAA
ncbi:MAG TPA: molybdopterin dinucleotide binding domain-containing protein, partial [Candidatus Angelobacter sp.]